MQKYALTMSRVSHCLLLRSVFLLLDVSVARLDVVVARLNVAVSRLYVPMNFQLPNRFEELAQLYFRLSYTLAFFKFFISQSTVKTETKITK